MPFSKDKYASIKNGEAVTAVALQDHLVRSLNLSLSLSHPLGNKPSLEHKLAYKKPRGKAVVNSHHSKKTPLQETNHKEKEYVLDTKPPPATLAQKLGLFEQPKPLLDEKQWKDVKDRAKERQDFAQPCVICKEDIGKLCHVLLSCTHVFHKSCLKAFEQFSGKKSCPMCRKEQYQTRVVYDGSPAYKHKCACRIQAAWRGYVVRCWYRNIRETVPPKDSKLRQKFFEDKLHKITERMVRSMDLNTNTFLYEVDRNLEVSRSIFQKFDSQLKVMNPEDWMDVYRKAIGRGAAECPICLTALVLEGEKAKKAVLTSCSHAFHETCLTMFETLTDVTSSTSCPVCRSGYQRKILECNATKVLG